jgi:hypothetical protein
LTHITFRVQPGSAALLIEHSKVILPSNPKFKQTFTHSSLHSVANPLYEMPFDSFGLFPLLPIEIRVLIWIMTFPEGRRFEPWKWECMQYFFKQPPFSGPGFNLANTDPVALWVNQESREEVFKHYTTREPLHLKRLERMYNIRWPAHIDFSRDIISFGWNRACLSIGPCNFLSKTEMDNTAHMELSSPFDIPFGISLTTSLTRRLNEQISLYSNLQDIFIHVECSAIKGDTWVIWHHDPDYEETGSISRDLKEARRMGEALLEQFDTQCRDERRAWKRPLLFLKASLRLERPPVKEVMQLMEDFRHSAG